MVDFLLHILIMANIYIILSVSFNILLGYAELFSMAQGAFFGIGSYVVAIFVMKFGVNFLVAILIGILFATIISGLLAIPALRVSGDYLVIASLGFQVLIYSVFLNWESVTNGSAGLAGIPRPRLLGYTINSLLEYFILSLLFMLVCLFITNRVLNSPFGRLLKAIRDDEVAAKSFGKNVTYIKVKAFMVSGGLAAIAGGIYAQYATYVSPGSFTIEESILILSMVIIGGAGTTKGPILGALILTFLPQVLRFVWLPEQIAANLRQIIYGALLVAFMMFRPQGIFGKRKIA